MADSPLDNLTFEEALAELERVVRELEDGQVGLEASLTCYEKGISLLKRCHGQLRAAEQRIMILTGVDEAGQPMTAPFEHAATAVNDANEDRKRTARRRPPPENTRKIFD